MRFLTISEVAETLQIPASKIREQVDSGIGPPHVVYNGVPLFPEDLVLEFNQKRRRRDVGRSLVRMRNAARMDPPTVAEKLGVTRQCVSYHESCFDAKLSTLVRFANLYGQQVRVGVYHKSQFVHCSVLSEDDRFAELLKLMRTRDGRSQTYLATVLDVTKQAISSAERADDVSTAKLHEVALATNCHVSIGVWKPNGPNDRTLVSANEFGVPRVQ